MAIISSGITTLTDLNDAIISGTQPVNPTAGTLWIDSSKSPAVLKIYKNGAWATQDLDLNSLDPNMAESIRNVVATIGNMSNDNLLDYKERQIIKDDLTEILGKVLLDTEIVLPTVAQLEVLAKGSFYSTRRNALNAGIETSNSIYTDVATQYQNLKTYLESLTPIKPWNVAVADKDKNVTVIKNTFRDKWLQYYLATEKLSLTTTEKIKEAQDNLDGKISEVSLRDKTEILSGNPVFTDKSDDAVVHVGVDGKSEQTSASGKNLIGYKEIKNYPARSGYLDTHNVTLTVKPNTVYTVSSNVPQDAGGYNVLYFNGLAGSDCPFIGNKVTKTSDSLGNLYILVFEKRTNGTKVMDGTYYIQLEEGNTATAYEEYKPPAPSPDYPIAINSLDKSFDIVSSVGKENIVLDSHFTNSSSGWNGMNSPMTRSESIISIIADGSNPLFARFEYSKKLSVGWHTITVSTKSNTPLRFSGFVNTDIVNASSSVFGGDNSWATHRISFNVLDSNINTVIRLYLLDGSLGKRADMDWFKIEKGIVESSLWTPAPEEVPYNTPSSTLYKTNISLSEPLRSVGDVKDRVYLNDKGLWEVERNVGVKILYGTDEILKNNNVENDTNHLYYIRGGNFPNLKLNTSNVVMSHLKKTATLGELHVDNKIGFFLASGVVYLNTNIATNTRNAMNAWLASNLVTVQYELQTPTTETLSAEQQTKLNNIQSFKGVNYVYTMGNLTPNLNAKFKSNMWYRMNVLGEKQVSGNRNWASNGNFAYPLEKSLWSSYYKGTVKETVDISTETPPFKNALHIKQTTSGVAGIIDAVIWEGASANVLAGQNVSMATWLKYQNVTTSELTMNVQVTGKKSDGTFVYETYKVFSYTGTDATWKRLTGTVKLALPAGAIEITRIVFRLGLAGSGTGEFWATGIQLETGNSLGDWTSNPDDTKDELNKTEARLILTEKEVGLSVKKGELINGVFVNGDGTRIKGENLEIDANTKFNRDLIMNAGVIRSADGGTTMDLNTNTFNFSKPITFNYKPVPTTDDVIAITDTKESKIEVMGGTAGKIFKNPVSFNSNISAVTGCLVIKTPILSPFMTKVSITGYNYAGNTASIDLDISFYAYTASQFVNFSYVNKGNYPINNVRLARNSAGQAIIIIGNETNVWNYPKIQVTQAIVTQSNPPDSYKDGWSIEYLSVLTGLTAITNVTGTDYKSELTTAQTDATNAKTSAGTANQLLADLSNDNILTPVEKKSIKKEWDIIVSEKVKIDVEASEYSISTEKTLYNNHYSALNTYITPLLANLNINSTIVATSFRVYFKNYYDARQDVLNAITSKAKALADTAQASIDGLDIGGNNLQPESSLIDKKSFASWSTTDVTAILVEEEYTRLVRTSTDTNRAMFASAKNLMDVTNNFSVGDSITFSIDIYIESLAVNGSTVFVRWNDSANNMITDSTLPINTTIPKGKWVRISSTSTIPANADLTKTSPVRVGIQGIATFRIKNLQIEKGNKPTGWAEASVDSEERIAEYLEGKADQLAFEEAMEDLALAKSLAEDALNSGTYATFIEGYEAYRGVLAEEKTIAEDALKLVQDTVVAIENNLGESAEQWNFIQTSITNSEQGISITNEGSPMGVMISNDRISFYDNGVEVAFISDKVLQINHGIFVQSAQIGAHLISSLPENPDITVVEWVGL